VKAFAIVGTLLAAAGVASSALAQTPPAPSAAERPPTGPSAAERPQTRPSAAKAAPMPDLPPPEPPASEAPPPAAPHAAPAAASPAATPPALSSPSPSGAPAATTLAPDAERPQVALTPSGAGAVDRTEAPSPAGPGHEVVARLELGYRGVFVTNPGYNPFSTQDYFSGAYLAVSRTVVSEGAFSFAPGLAWDYGSSSATSRGDAATLMVHRLSVPLEGRLHAGVMGYAFLRIAPGMASEHVEVSDASAPSSLTKTQWLFMADASVGYALPFVPIPPRHGRTFRLWIVGDGGYSWVADQHLTLQSTVPANGTPMVNQVDLGTLGLRGGFFRFAVAASY
jgi:hypothetical protein